MVHSLYIQTQKQLLTQYHIKEIDQITINNVHVMSSSCGISVHFHLSLIFILVCIQLHKNSLGLLKKGAVKLSRMNSIVKL